MIPSSITRSLYDTPVLPSQMPKNSQSKDYFKFNNHKPSIWHKLFNLFRI